MSSNYKSIHGLIHWLNQIPHGPVTSQKPSFWTLLHREPSLQHISLFYIQTIRHEEEDQRVLTAQIHLVIKVKKHNFAKILVHTQKLPIFPVHLRNSGMSTQVISRLLLLHYYRFYHNHYLLSALVILSFEGMGAAMIWMPSTNLICWNWTANMIALRHGAWDENPHKRPWGREFTVLCSSPCEDIAFLSFGLLTPLVLWRFGKKALTIPYLQKRLSRLQNCKK